MDILRMDHLEKKNSLSFSIKGANSITLLDNIKLQPFLWLKSKYTTFVFYYHLWGFSPIMCLRELRSMLFLCSFCFLDFVYHCN